jgi:putative phage-type endonuclease
MYKPFGDLGKIIKYIEKIINKNYKDFNGDKEELNILTKYVYDKVILKYPETEYKLVQDIIGRFFSCQYTFNQIDFNDGYNGFRNWDQKYIIDEIDTDTINVPEQYKELEKHFQTLYATPQPEQRTKEWFEYRFNRITASDTASAIDLNPYDSVEGFICKKCDPDFPFLDNPAVFHGKKYEQIATQLYEHIYNIKVTEFGCVPSSKYKILGASPDGICSKATLDNQFSPMLGTMLEIKCPFRRKIETSGRIAGEICPYYYYCQVQQQLECCNLDKCDFWQCEIKQYNSREDYLKDIEFETAFFEGDKGKFIPIDNILARGCLLQFLPKVYEPTHDEDEHQFKSKYIYPPRLDMSQSQYDDWCLDIITRWQTEDPEMAKDYYFDKVIYWKIPKSHNVTIKRDTKWFNDVFPILQETWKKVLYYRDNLNELPPLQDIADSKKKFYRLNTKIEVNNIEGKFLENKKNIKKNTKKNYKKKKPDGNIDVDIDFID